MEQFSKLKAFGQTRSYGLYHQLPSDPLASGSDSDLSQSPLDEADKAAVRVTRNWEMLYHRSTYYRIAFVSLALELLVAAIAGYLSGIEGKKADPNFCGFLIIGFYSLLCLLSVGVLLWWQYKKQINTNPPSKVNAQTHVALCICVCLMCTMITVFVFILDKSRKDFPSGDVRTILVRTMSLFSVIPGGALCIAARITYCAAAKVRGTQLIPLVRPTPTAPAWTLATTAESQSIHVKRFPTEGFSALLKGLPLSFRQIGGRGDYQQLSTSDSHLNDSGSGLIVGALQQEERKYHRSTYYWVAFASSTLELFLGIVALCMSGGKGKDENAEVIRFALTTLYSVFTLGSLFILLWWQHKLQVDTNPPSKVNALSHIALSITTSGVCFLMAVLLCVLGKPTGKSSSGDPRKNLVQLMVLLLLVTIGNLCFASWITFSAAVRARGTGRVSLPPLPARNVRAWMLATTSESQSILAEVEVPRV